MIRRYSSSTCRIKFIGDWLIAGLIRTAAFLAESYRIATINTCVVEILRSRAAVLKAENTELELCSCTANLKPCSNHKQLKIFSWQICQRS